MALHLTFSQGSSIPSEFNGVKTTLEAHQQNAACPSNAGNTMEIGVVDGNRALFCVVTTTGMSDYLTVIHALITNGYADMDIRSLRHAGQLIIRGDQAKLTPNRLMPTLGWIYFLIFSFVFSVSAVVVCTSSAVEWRQNLGLSVIAAMWLASVVFVNKVHLEPWRLLKRAGLIASAS